jgi:hypothetical protein
VGHRHQTILDVERDDADMSGKKGDALELLVEWMSALMQCRVDEDGCGDGPTGCMGIELGPEVYYCLTAVELCDPRSLVVEWWCRKTK